MSAFASLKTTAAYCPQARALFARLATQPAPARAAAYDAMIRALLVAGVWAKLDALYLLAAADAATALTNLKQSGYGLTAVNSPSFVADRGYTGNGTTQYLDPSFTPSTAGGLFAQNSASLFWWIRTRNVGNPADGVGAYTGSGATASAFLFLSDPGVGMRLNSASAGDLGGGSTAAQAGLWAAARTGANDIAAYYNGAVEASSGGKASSGLPAVPMIVLGYKATTDLCKDEISAAGWGAGLDATEHAALYNAIHSYLQAVGAVA
jgi:hypothetical protein